MFEKILVPVDGSTFGELALPLALGIAARSGGELTVATVITPLPGAQPQDEADPAETERLSLAGEQARGYQEQLRERIQHSGSPVPLSCHLVTGSVVEELDRHARDTGVDLLVMTTHGRGPLRRAWLGSVADGLLRRTPSPILAVRPREDEEVRLADREIRRILVTLDGSPESREILPFAKALAALFGASMILLRVIPPHFSLTSAFTSHTTHEFGGPEQEEAAAKKALAQEAMELEGSGLSVEVDTVVGVHPAEGILSYAEAREVDLVAMATHGRGGVARLILGSVADKVIRSGMIPVLLHRAG